MKICFYRRDLNYIIALLKNNRELRLILAMFVLLVLTMTFGLVPSSLHDIRNDYPNNLVDVYCDEITDITVSRRSTIAYPNGINVFWKEATGLTSGKYSIASDVLELSALEVASELEELIGKTVVVSYSRSNDGVPRIRGIEHDGKVYIDKNKTCEASRQYAFENIVFCICLWVLFLFLVCPIAFRIVWIENKKENTRESI